MSRFDSVVVGNDLVSEHWLAELAREYERVFVAAGAPDLAEAVASDFAEHAHVRLIELAVDHEEVPEVICGLALGYPPEVTAGSMLHRRAHPDEWGNSAEYGAWCEHSPAVAA